MLKKFKSPQYRRVVVAGLGLAVLSMGYQNCGGRFSVDPKSGSFAGQSSGQGGISGVSQTGGSSTSPPTSPVVSVPQISVLPDTSPSFPDRNCDQWIDSVASFKEALRRSVTFSEVGAPLRSGSLKTATVGQYVYCLSSDLDFNGENFWGPLTDAEKDRFTSYQALSTFYDSSPGQGNHITSILVGRGKTMRNFNLTTIWPFEKTQDIKLLDWSANVLLHQDQVFLYSSSTISLLSGLEKVVIATGKTLKLRTGYHTNCVDVELDRLTYVPVIGCPTIQARLSLFPLESSGNAVVSSQIEIGNLDFEGGRVGVGGGFKDSNIKLGGRFGALQLVGSETQSLQLQNSVLDIKLKVEFIGTRPDLELRQGTNQNTLFGAFPSETSAVGGRIIIDLETVNMKRFSLFLNQIQSPSKKLENLELTMKFKSNFLQVGGVETSSTPDEFYGLSRSCPDKILNSKLDFKLEFQSSSVGGLLASGLCPTVNPAGLSIEKSNIQIQLSTYSKAADRRYTAIPHRVLSNGSQISAHALCHRSVVGGLILWHSFVQSIQGASFPSLEIIGAQKEVPFSTSTFDPFGDSQAPRAFAGLALTDSEVNVVVRPMLDRIGAVRGQAGGVIGAFPHDGEVPISVTRSRLRTNVAAEMSQFESSGVHVMELFGGTFVRDRISTDTSVGSIKTSVFSRTAP